MMKIKRSSLFILLMVFTFVITACGLKFEENPDGSTRMEITLDEAAMQTKIQQSIKDSTLR